jgi:hypothetical protein
MAETNIFPTPQIRQSDQTDAGSLPVATVPDLTILTTKHRSARAKLRRTRMWCRCAQRLF